PHWAPVWDRLAARCRVIAPDLPRIAMREAAGPRSFAEYADWTARVLDSVGVREACIAGNSFGAGVAWCFASRHRIRCRGLVLVNGGRPVRFSKPVRWLLARTSVRQRVMRSLAKQAYSPQSGLRAFVDPARIPAAVAAAFVQERPPQLDAVYDVLLGGACPK